MNTQEPEYLQHLRRLTKFLFLSGALNILLIALLFHFWIREAPPTPYFELKPAEHKDEQEPLALDRTNSDLLRHFKGLPLEQLITKLDNTQLVDNGYTQRDLALAALIAFHHFDLSRALLGHPEPSQKRKLRVRSSANTYVDVIIYPSLSEEQFTAIRHFAKTERWPVTSRGLFALLRKQSEPDSSLLDAFYATPEFSVVETLFKRSEVPIDRKALLTLIFQAPWKPLASFAAKQRTSQDLSPARRQRFLLDYLQYRAPLAATLLLKTDGAFAAKKLEDSQVLLMLQVLTEKTPESEQFALALLTNPRSDIVWQRAAERLYAYAKETPPKENLHHAALMRFMPNTSFAKEVSKKAKPKTVVASASPAPAIQKAKKASPSKSVLPKKQIAQAEASSSTSKRAPRLYVIQEGDSLWKISKQFKVDVETLKKYNKLRSDFLKPGTTLRIP